MHFDRYGFKERNDYLKLLCLHALMFRKSACHISEICLLYRCLRFHSLHFLLVYESHARRYQSFACNGLL